MAPPVGIPFHRFTAAVYGAPEGSLAQPEVSRLLDPRFDTRFWSKPYLQCIGRGLNHATCVKSLPDYASAPAGGPLSGDAGKAGLTAAITEASQGATAAQLDAHFDKLARLAGYEDPVIKTSFQKAQEFSSKAGWKMLGFPALYVVLKYVKIR
uniref:Uncharacterized protein n=1 Tax=Noctiluca scintillans TaxID=2966 RepID=A0A7S1AIR6_NOCSC